jgi:DNA-binding LytR/AlgR family response regulator
LPEASVTTIKTKGVDFLLNIAICDDTIMLRDIFEQLVHEYEDIHRVRFNIFRFASGEELLQKFDKDYKFADLFFLDYFMKAINGIETAKRIRQKNSACDIVFVTSAASENLYEFTQVLPLEILPKPADKEKVFDILTTEISKEGELKPIKK